MSGLQRTDCKLFYIYPGPAIALLYYWEPQGTTSKLTHSNNCICHNWIQKWSQADTQTTLSWISWHILRIILSYSQPQDSSTQPGDITQCSVHSRPTQQNSKHLAQIHRCHFNLPKFRNSSFSRKESDSCQSQSTLWHTFLFPSSKRTSPSSWRLK